MARMRRVQRVDSQCQRIIARAVTPRALRQRHWRETSSHLGLLSQRSSVVSDRENAIASPSPSSTRWAMTQCLRLSLSLSLSVAVSVPVLVPSPLSRALSTRNVAPHVACELELH